MKTTDALVIAFGDDDSNKVRNYCHIMKENIKCCKIKESRLLFTKEFNSGPNYRVKFVLLTTIVRCQSYSL